MDSMPKFDPWAEAAQANQRAQDGVPFSWKTFAFVIRRRSMWCNAYASALARIRTTPKNAAFIKRTSARNYVESDEDRSTYRRLLMDAFIEGCIVSWDVAGPDGNPLALNLENGRKLFTTFPDLWDDIQSAADADETFVPEPTTDEKLGN